MALVDERGCRRDIRSNGWIDFRESSLFQNRSGRRNKFSSFGAESLLRNFPGPKARLKSGPDVFADALVPRNASRSPERPVFPGTPCGSFAALPAPGTSIFPNPLHAGPTAHGPRAQLRARPGSGRSRACTAAHWLRRALRRFISGTFANTSSSACADHHAREMRDVAMVIVVRNGRVNRSSRILTCCGGTATSVIPHRRARRARLHPVHRDI
jgi:hypothetical protein